MTLSACVLAVLGLCLASSAYLHFRGRDRFKLRRALTDYSVLLAPINAFACLCNRGRNRPFHDLARFPELDVLRAHWTEIRAEAAALLGSGAVKASARQDDVVFHAFMKRGWKRFYVKWYRDFLPSARALCPRTCELLAALPNVHSAMFAVLEPGVRLGKHRDPFAGTLRYHLGLITPNSEDCRMFVDGERYVWRDGEPVLFDSSYLHKAANKTDKPRLLLFCDVERPMRGPVSRAVNRWLIRWIVPMTQVPNVAGEKTGLMNRAFALLKPVRAGIAALKRRTTVGYYALKLGGVAGVVVLLWPW
jgi:beta-hydroxylase